MLGTPLLRTLLTENFKTNRNIKGIMHKHIYIYIYIYIPCNSFKSAHSNKVYSIFQDLTCRSDWLVYLMECRLCPKIQYVGKSEPPANIRINKHRDDCKIETSVEIDQHFRSPGHTFNERLNTRTKTKLERREILENQRGFLDNGTTNIEPTRTKRKAQLSTQIYRNTTECVAREDANIYVNCRSNYSN